LLLFLLSLSVLFVLTFSHLFFSFFFFFNDTATTEIYTLSLHDALPISRPGAATPAKSVPRRVGSAGGRSPSLCPANRIRQGLWRDRKSTRLNSSHVSISYAVFCLKKKKKIK